MPVSITRSEPAPITEPTDGNGAIPPLKDGDRLSRDEFERRYDAMPQLKKAELIEGVVSMPSPVGCEHHGEPHSTLYPGGMALPLPGEDPGCEARR